MSRRQVLSALEAAEIRRLYDTGRYSMQTLAAQFNCSATTIWRVVNRTDAYKSSGRERVIQLLDDIEEMLVALSLTIEDTLEDLAGIKEDVQFGQRSTKELTMNTQQYIAEHLDPMDTVVEWQSGEAFADAILENADGELPVTREDLVDYWRDARYLALAMALVLAQETEGHPHTHDIPPLGLTIDLSDKAIDED